MSPSCRPASKPPPRRCAPPASAAIPATPARAGPARLWLVAGYGVLAALALGLRLWFILGVSKISPVWDAGLYWHVMVGVRDALCQQLGACAVSGY